MIHTTIHIGASEPFKMIHISDTHLCFADERDDDRKIKLAADRSVRFPQAENILKAVEEFNIDRNYTIIHTGDLIDFVSYANLEAAKNFTDHNDVIMSVGNHEFSLYVGEAFEDDAYKNQSLDRVQQAFKNNIRYSSRIINGINFIAIDNSYYTVNKEQLEFLQKQCDADIPIILLLHIPLYTEALYYHMMIDKNCNDAAIMNVPPEKMTKYSDFRRTQQTSDEITKQAYEFIVNCKNIKAILTGHLHFDYENQITTNLTQYITGKTSIRILEFN